MSDTQMNVELFPGDGSYHSEEASCESDRESGYSEFDEIDVGYLDAYSFDKDDDGNHDKEEKSDQSLDDKVKEIVDCVDRELEAIDGEEEDTNKIIIDCENELNSMQSEAN